MGPTGPCGPCTEIFYDTGAAYASAPATPVRTKAIATSKFGTSSSSSTIAAPTASSPSCRARRSIPAPGFERMLAVANGKASMYETDLFTDVIAAQPRDRQDLALPAGAARAAEIIADHARAVTFLIADGDLSVEYRPRLRAALPDPAGDSQRPPARVSARVPRRTRAGASSNRSRRDIRSCARVSSDMQTALRSEETDVRPYAGPRHGDARSADRRRDRRLHAAASRAKTRSRCTTRTAFRSS